MNLHTSHQYHTVLPIQAPSLQGLHRNSKLQLVERDENPLKYSSLNLLEKVKFNSGGRVVAGSNPVTPTDGKAW